MTPEDDAAAPPASPEAAADALSAAASDAASAESPAAAADDALPDRLSVDPASRHHVAAAFERGIGIRLNGKERFDVEEYCISEGWIKVPAGRALDRKGRPLLITLKGRVEAFRK